MVGIEVVLSGATLKEVLQDRMELGQLHATLAIAVESGTQMETQVMLTWRCKGRW